MGSLWLCRVTTSGTRRVEAKLQAFIGCPWMEDNPLDQKGANDMQLTQESYMAS